MIYITILSRSRRTYGPYRTIDIVKDGVRQKVLADGKEVAGIYGTMWQWTEDSVAWLAEDVSITAMAPQR